VELLPTKIFEKPYSEAVTFSTFFFFFVQMIIPRHMYSKMHESAPPYLKKEKQFSFLVKAGQAERCVNHVYVGVVFKREFRPSEARFVL
jgi:hypothetical protein